MKNDGSKTKNELLETYIPIADAISSLFFPNVEVVLHDLASQEVVYISNNLSKRKIGDPAGLDAIGFTPDAKVIGPYEKLNWDGKKIRSVSVVARNANAEPKLLICINMNVSVFEEARNALDLFLSITKVQPQPESLFKDDWQERINTFLHHWLKENQSSLSTLSQAQKRELVSALYAEGAFHAKHSAEYIANVLSLGRATIFKYLKALRAPSGR
ncbi:PAS domain-containing protein [Leeia sp. TBRC 13508]|uniref:PAS domain-containing protein n=1 Tax=Leeia speluncae TaxID=2884804 RepID=A0ABS8DBU2_9NEIS|nr:PAS domain-containing protein [Leeia speluncae]MCB6185103.1 PAS domain-containing protein [Leeia speluncae]